VAAAAIGHADSETSMSPNRFARLDADLLEPLSGDKQQHANCCRLLAHLCPSDIAPAGSSIFRHLLGLSLASLLRLSFAHNFYGYYFKTKGHRGNRSIKKPGDACYLSAVDAKGHSHAFRDALDLAALWGTVAPDVATKMHGVNLAGEKALGALPVLCAIGFPSTLLQHTVRFHRQLHSATVVWCRQLYTQRLAAGAPIELIEPIVTKKGAPAERNLCYWLVYLIQHGVAFNLQAAELGQLACGLGQDGIFVQPYEMRSHDLRTFILDTIAFNRVMEHQLNQIEHPQLFSSPSVSSVATMQMDTLVRTPQSPPYSPASPASSVRSSPSSPVSVSLRRPFSELDSPLPLTLLTDDEQFEQAVNEYDNALRASKRRCTGLGPHDRSSPQVALIAAHCQDLTDGDSSLSTADSSSSPSSTPPADPPQPFDPDSMLNRSFLDTFPSE